MENGGRMRKAIVAPGSWERRSLVQFACTRTTSAGNGCVLTTVRIKSAVCFTVAEDLWVLGQRSNSRNLFPVK